MSSLEILQCPRCASSLRAGTESGGGRLDEVELACSECGSTYPIRSGFVHFASKDEVKRMYPEMEEQARKGARLHDVFLARFLELLELDPDTARAAYLQYLGLQAGSRVLDVGVGTGWDYSYLLERTPNLELFGLDTSVEMLRQCRRKLTGLNTTAELYVGFAEHLPFRSDSFDAVLHVGSINEFHDPHTALLEMARVAAPGAPVVVADEWLTEENLEQTTGQRLIEAFPSLPTRSSPPDGAVPDGMQDVGLDTIWHGYGYCLHFRKPALSGVPGEATS